MGTTFRKEKESQDLKLSQIVQPGERWNLTSPWNYVGKHRHLKLTKRATGGGGVKLVSKQKYKGMERVSEKALMTPPKNKKNVKD